MTGRRRTSLVLLINLCLILIDNQLCDSYVITTNKMRYSTNQVDKMASSESFPSHFIENVKPMPILMSNVNNDYKINHRFKTGRKANEQSNAGNMYELDTEDKSLLDKFYGETRSQDPLLGDSLTPEKLWNESNEDEMEKLNAFLDLNPTQQQHQQDILRDILQTQQQNHLQTIDDNNHDDWTIDKELIERTKMLSSIQDMIPMAGNNLAHYSPSLRLLTSYDPISGADKLLAGQERGLRSNRIVGATVYGRDEQTKPNVSSKSPVEAIRLHDDLMSEKPHDGKVRVRMYFHRAIHDDAKLYGTGPWRYWGHGWGVEFGYDPSKVDKNDFYQKGYTIERAFGRDFCKDPKNCRPPDPDFFKGTINRVKEYNHENQPRVEIKPFMEDVNTKKYRR